MVSSSFGGSVETGSRVRSRRQRFDTGERRVKSEKLPHSIEAEESLLSCCLIDAAEGGDTLERCREAGISRETFYAREVGVAFAKLLELHASGVPVDPALLIQALQAEGHFAGREGAARFAAMVSRSPTTAQARYFIDQVRELALRRAKHRLASAIAEDCLRGDEEALRGHMSELADLEAYGKSPLPPVMAWRQLVTKATPMPPELVAGVLHKGRRMILAGGSKSFKSWVLLDLAVAIATGTPWWGVKTAQGKVLYVNFELPEWGLRERLKDIARARQGLTEGQEPELSENLEVWDLDGYGADIDALLPHFEARLLRGQYSLVILDPIYVCLGERDENSNGDVTQLMNRLAWLARRTGAAVAFGHHFSKGNQAERDAKDRASGAGAWVRAPDTVVTLTPHEEEGCFVASFVLRSQKPKKDFVVRWKHPCMEVAPGLNPGALKKPGAPRKMTAGDFAGLLEAGELLTYSEFLARAESRREVSKSTFKRLLEEAQSEGLIEKSAGCYRLPEAAK